MTQIDGVEDLEFWLNQQGIDTASWGCGSTKSVADLWTELKNGEITLQCDPPLREVGVVQIIIRRDDLVLLEVEQEFETGKRRSRNIFPSEKLRNQEDYLSAAKRGLKEEIDLDPQQVDFVEPSYKIRHQVSNSPSYPNLATRYTIHSIEAAVTELPLADFWRKNHAHAEGDPVKKHLWGWRLEQEASKLR